MRLDINAIIKIVNASNMILQLSIAAWKFLRLLVIPVPCTYGLVCLFVLAMRTLIFMVKCRRWILMEAAVKHDGFKFL